MENIIEVRNLKYKYDSESENYTLNDVSFQVKKGEWLSIVGHNGSGKSTTVRLIDGLLEAESGDIIISVDRAKEQAEEYGHSLERELGFLALHGFLHLNGYDHQTEEEEKEMTGLQTEILTAYGLTRNA